MLQFDSAVKFNFVVDVQRLQITQAKIKCNDIA